MRQIIKYPTWGVDQGDNITTIRFYSAYAKIIVLYHKNHADECSENIKGAIDFFYDKKFPLMIELEHWKRHEYIERLSPDEYEFDKDELYQYIHKALSCIYGLSNSRTACKKIKE